MKLRFEGAKRRACLAVAASAVSAGCANRPDAVYELANKTDANVGLLAAQLHQIARDSDELYDKRAANIARQAQVTAQARGRLTADLWLTKKVGDGSDLTLMDDLKDWLSQADQLARSAQDADKTRREALAAAKERIDEKTVPLGKVSSALSALAKRETAEERAKLIAGFGKEVRDDVKKELDDGAASSNAAKALLDHIKGAAAPASSPQ